MGFGGEKMFLDYYSHFWSRKWEQEEKKNAQGIEASEEQSGHAVWPLNPWNLTSYYHDYFRLLNF